MMKQKRKGNTKEPIEPRWTKEGIITVIFIVIALTIMILWGIPNSNYYPGAPKVPPFND